MRLILVRHGDAHAGLHGVIAGRRGCRGLTELGRRQAALLRDHLATRRDLHVEVLVTSALPRAIETAEIIASALAVRDIPQDCDLCEMHTGEADGIDWTEYTDQYGAFDMVAEPDRPFAPGGDSWNSFNERVGRAMQRLAAAHERKTVMAVCHAGVIAASLGVLFGGPPDARRVRLQPTNTSLTEWEHEAAAAQWTLRYYNDISHLRSFDD